MNPLELISPNLTKKNRQWIESQGFFTEEIWLKVFETHERLFRNNKITNLAVALCRKLLETSPTLKCVPIILRTRSGLNQRNAGAWRFYLITGPYSEIGCCYKVSTLMKPNIKLDLMNTAGGLEIVGDD